MKCNEVKVWTIRECAEQYTIRTPEDCFRIWSDEVVKSPMYSPDKEMFVVFHLSAKNHVKGFEIVTVGIADANLVHPRETFRSAIVAGAIAVVVAHNHPSGECYPSAEDIRITRQLIEAGRIVDIKVMDHVIIGHGQTTGRNWMSMRESGIVNFS